MTMGSSKLQDKKKFAKEVVLASVDIWETGPQLCRLLQQLFACNGVA